MYYACVLVQLSNSWLEVDIGFSTSSSEKKKQQQNKQNFRTAILETAVVTVILVFSTSEFR